jgi:hypothetical protein
VFLDFLGMLRSKFLDRNEGMDYTFKSVILGGVHDVKNLKIKLDYNEERKYNSPWNIAADFNVDLSFVPNEISTMLYEYLKDNKISIDVKKISNQIYKYSKGYPFLVSKICKVIDENLDKDWNNDCVKKSVKIILETNNTLFDDIIKNFENNNDLYDIVKRILLEGESIDYNYANPKLNKGIIYGIFSKSITGGVEISNSIFELYIYNYMVSKRNTDIGNVLKHEYKDIFIKDKKLNIVVILNKFQELMKCEYREKDREFIEREGRLLFLCFIKPIINGKGFYYVEPETRMDSRMDIVITYGDNEYVIELKKWYGQKKYKEGLKQLTDYLDNRLTKTGFMITFNFNKNKEYKKEWITLDGYRIYSIIV